MATFPVLVVVVEGDTLVVSLFQDDSRMYVVTIADVIKHVAAHFKVPVSKVLKSVQDELKRN